MYPDMFSWGGHKPESSKLPNGASLKNVQLQQQKPEQKPIQFGCKLSQDKNMIVKLNHQYQIDPQHKLYDTIQVLIMLINQKNEKANSKYHIKDTFGINYFSTLEFILGKCKMEDEKCTICLQEFEIKDVEKELAQESDEDIYMLKCSHKYHMACLMNLIGENKWAKCPVCSMIFGKMAGDQPEGTMTVNYDKHTTLPGHSKGSIIIQYHLNSGMRNGVRFQGTTRVAYLPDSKEGREVLRLLEEAFNRKLIFTVGRSVTTGLDNQTVWNGIHHKTRTHGGAANFGYPDATYLDRVKEELAAKGITLDTI